MWYYCGIVYKLGSDVSLHTMNNKDLRDFLGFALVLAVLTYFSLGDNRGKYALSSPSAFIDFFSDIFSPSPEDPLSNIKENNQPSTPEPNSKNLSKPTAEEKQPQIKENVKDQKPKEKVKIKEEPKPKKEIKIQPEPEPERKKEIIKEPHQEEKATISIPDKGALIYYDTPPEIKELDLKYPKNARTNKIEGIVYIEFYLNKDGKVLKADIYQGLQERSLNDAAKDAVLNSKWKPALNKGDPVGVWTVVPIEFNISQEFY